MGRFVSPDTGQQGERHLVALYEVYARGEAGIHDFIDDEISMIDLFLRKLAPGVPARSRVRYRHYLFVCLAWGMACADSAAQADEEGGAVVLPSVVVTATRTSARVDQTVADVTVLTREDIERATGRTLPELLALQPGLQFSSSGGMGKSSSVNIRGMESRHTLLLIDGVRYGSATAGMPSFDNLPLDSIERIEIVRGPMSGLYGSDAVGGVIQIFTRKGREGIQLNAAASAGSRGFARGAAGVGFAEGAWSGAMHLSHTETQGFSATNERADSPFFQPHDPDDDGFRQDAGSAQLSLRLGGDWVATTRVLYSSGLNEIDDGPGVNSRNRMRSEVVSADLRGSALPNWHSVTRVARSFDSDDALASASAFAELGAFSTEQMQLSREDSIATSAGTVLLLADYVKQTVSKPGSPFDASQRSILGVALGLNGEQGPHTWHGNLRHDRNSQFGNQNSGSLGYGYDLTPAWRIGVSRGKGFVAPSFNQLYYPQFGNPNLLPEIAWLTEANVSWHVGAHKVRASRYLNKVRGFITSDQIPVNIDAKVQGISLTLDTQVDDWALSSSIDHVDGRNDSAANANYGKQLARRASNSFKFAVDGPWGPLRAGATLTAFGARFDDMANNVRVAGYAALDLRADWRFARRWSLGMRLNNVANKHYETISGYNQPGREGYLTLTYSPQ